MKYSSGKSSGKGCFPQQVQREGYTPTKFVDYNPIPVSPLKKQFEPTEKDQTRQHYQMAGGC